MDVIVYVQRFSSPEVRRGPGSGVHARHAGVLCHAISAHLVRRESSLTAGDQSLILPFVLLDPSGSLVHIYIVQPQLSPVHLERGVGHIAVAVIDPGRGLHDLVSFNGDFRAGPMASSDFSLSYSNPDDLPQYYSERGQDVVEYVYSLSPGEERRLALRIRTLAASSDEFLSCVEAARSVLVSTPTFRFLDNAFLRVLTFGPPGLGRALDWAEELDLLSWQESIFHEAL